MLIRLLKKRLDSACMDFGGRFIGVKTIGKPSSGLPRGGPGRFIEVAA